MSSDPQNPTDDVGSTRPSPIGGRRNTRVYAAIAVLLLGLVGVGVWYAYFRTVRDPDGAVSANNRGIGEMEQFQYASAADAFREAARKDPDWIVPRINLAIAILNLSEGNDPEVVAILKKVLESNPDNPHANYTLGFYLKHHGRLGEAFPYFDKVSELDPNDAYTWLHKGICHPDGEDSPAGLACFQTALRLDPYLNAARYKLFGLARAKERQALLDELQRLKAAYWEHQYSSQYTDQGPYAQVIGRTTDSHPPQPTGPIPALDAWERFRVELAAGTRWADVADLGPGPAGDLRRLLRDRFGATLVLFDYNRDGRTDLLLLAAVVRGRALGNLLLRNEGDGRFADVTAEAGLGDLPPGVGCAVADFDNDDFRDLLITGVDGVLLLRNGGAGSFVDVTAQAGVRLTGVLLGAGWVDLDQDSDLDFVACRISETIEGALAALGGKGPGDGGIEVWFNRGDAPAVPQGQRQPPLRAAFGRAAEPESLLARGTFTNVIFTDFDDDKDVDLLLLADGKRPVAIRNDRLLRFTPLDSSIAEPAAWNGGTVLDVNHDGRSDLVLLPAGATPVALVSGRRPDAPTEPHFVPAATNAPRLAQGMAIDLDADGWTDILGLTAGRNLAFLHNDGQGRLVSRALALSIPAAADLLAATAADVDGDCHMDVLVWSAAQGLKVYRGQDNGNKSLRLELSGRYELDRTRTNADGIGCRVSAQSGRMWTGLENTTLAAGLGQSRLPLVLGLGRAPAAEVLRILWPDATHQAAVGLAACELHAIAEANRKPTSCPVLFVWDGNQFRYVTDLLGGGALGEAGPDGSLRPPRPEESIKIEPGLLVPRNHELILKIAEPMDEVMYLDRADLIAVDHPRHVDIYPDERFVVSGPVPTQELLVFSEAIHPVSAIDHKNRDVTAELRDRDKRYVSNFARRSWLGYAEEHWVELDFGDQLKRFKPGERLYLVLAGWTDYAYPESIYAATQAGVPTTVPALEVRDADSTWRTVGELGFPAGLPRVMTRELTGLTENGSLRLRIRTNLSVYWDRIVIAPLTGIAGAAAPASVRTTTLRPARATLAGRGFQQEIRPNGAIGPVEYDPARTESVAVTPWKGLLTRFGDVTELLHGDDDCFVIGGPGEEVTIAFDASGLPPVPDGHVRSYVLRTWGYCKDTAPTTVSGGRVEPLPFRGVRSYPQFTAEERRRADAVQAGYREKWNTRPAAGGSGSGPLREK